MELKAKMTEPLFGADSVILQFRVERKYQKECFAEYDRLKDKEVALKAVKYTAKRSSDANAYFHVLVEKLAVALNLGADEVKVNMVFDYGAIATENGEPVIVGILKAANAKKYYPYPKWLKDFTAKNGQEYSQYLYYKQTHTLDSAEMARLIDGVIHECAQLGIETLPPAELAALTNRWKPEGERI